VKKRMTESKIGEYGYRYLPIEGYKTKSGKKIQAHWKKVKFNWKET
jgi:hypothetical protein